MGVLGLQVGQWRPGNMAGGGVEGGSTLQRICGSDQATAQPLGHFHLMANSQLVITYVGGSKMVKKEKAASRKACSLFMHCYIFVCPGAGDCTSWRCLDMTTWLPHLFVTKTSTYNRSS